MTPNSTIAAIATSAQPAGLAVIRVSGTKAGSVLHAVFKGKVDPIERPRYLSFGKIVDYHSKHEIDTCLAVFMPGPNSYTGEDIAEFQFHGSPLIAQKILKSLLAFGVSPAEPGEFTKRAFLNGKIDLVQAEAIADLINAKNEASLNFINEQLSGRFSQIIESIAEPLRDTLAELTAYLDFSEEDIEPDKIEVLLSKVKSAKSKIEDILKTYDYGSYVREGYKVLLCGRPNVGKSSLLNKLLGRPRAIVTDVSGTTRDLIEEQINLEGYSFVLCDSAGITDSSDKVEKIGIELTQNKINWADLVLLIADASAPKEEWRQILAQINPSAKQIWMVINKIDLNPNAFSDYICDSNICRQNIYLSALTGSGIDNLVEALVEEVKSKYQGTDDFVVIANERHRQCLTKAKESLSKFIDDKLPIEIMTEEIRIALNSLESLVGRTTTEDILGRVFSKFCIGK